MVHFKHGRLTVCLNKAVLKGCMGGEGPGGREASFSNSSGEKWLVLNTDHGSKAGGRKRGQEKLIFVKFKFVFYLFDTY